MHAIINNAIPNPNLLLLFSKDPDIINTNPKNPQITGRICENIVVPIIAIFYHYYNLLFLII
jgi:hypothetical protein